MADQEEEDLKMALRMSMQQHESPEPKRSKPGDDTREVLEESLEVKNRLLQRELMAAAAEKRMTATKSSAVSVLKSVESVKDVKISGSGDEGKGKSVKLEKCKDKGGNLGTELSSVEAHHLFEMIFGSEVSKDVLAQWSNQGIR